MGFKIKKALKKIVKASPKVKLLKGVKKFFKGPKEPRAEAAESMLERENVKQQAGTGQISFTKESRI